MPWTDLLLAIAVVWGMIVMALLLMVVPVVVGKMGLQAGYRLSRLEAPTPEPERVPEPEPEPAPVEKERKVTMFAGHGDDPVAIPDEGSFAIFRKQVEADRAKHEGANSAN